MADTADEIEKIPFVTPRWCVVANVSEEYENAERPGSPHFCVGAKVYVVAVRFPGGWAATVSVLARHKGSSRWISLVMKRHFLENWRAILEYSPSILLRLKEASSCPNSFGGETDADKAACLEWAIRGNQHRLDWVLANTKRESIGTDSNL